MLTDLIKLAVYNSYSNLGRANGIIKLSRGGDEVMGVSSPEEDINATAQPEYQEASVSPEQPNTANQVSVTNPSGGYSSGVNDAILQALREVQSLGNDLGIQANEVFGQRKKRRELEKELEKQKNMKQRQRQDRRRENSVKLDDISNSVNSLVSSAIGTNKANTSTSDNSGMQEQIPETIQYAPEPDLDSANITEPTAAPVAPQVATKQTNDDLDLTDKDYSELDFTANQTLAKKPNQYKAKAKPKIKMFGEPVPIQEQPTTSSPSKFIPQPATQPVELPIDSVMQNLTSPPPAQIAPNTQSPAVARPSARIPRRTPRPIAPAKPNMQNIRNFTNNLMGDVFNNTPKPMAPNANIGAKNLVNKVVGPYNPEATKKLLQPTANKPSFLTSGNTNTAQPNKFIPKT